MRARVWVRVRHTAGDRVRVMVRVTVMGMIGGSALTSGLPQAQLKVKCP